MTAVTSDALLPVEGESPQEGAKKILDGKKKYFVIGGGVIVGTLVATVVPFVVTSPKPPVTIFTTGSGLATEDIGAHIPTGNTTSSGLAPENIGIHRPIGNTTGSGPVTENIGIHRPIGNTTGSGPVTENIGIHRPGGKAMQSMEMQEGLKSFNPEEISQLQPDQMLRVEIPIDPLTRMPVTDPSAWKITEADPSLIEAAKDIAEPPPLEEVEKTIPEGLDAGSVAFIVVMSAIALAAIIAGLVVAYQKYNKPSPAAVEESKAKSITRKERRPLLNPGA